MNSQPLTVDTLPDLTLSECDTCVQRNLNSKGHVYGLGAGGVVMKQHSTLPFSIRSSFGNNYNAREMVARLNESVCKAAEQAREEEMRKKIKENVTAKLTAQFNSQ